MKLGSNGARWAAAVQAYCVQRGYPVPDTEVRFHPARKWRWDIAWEERLLAVEIQGGVWTGGRHTRGKGFEDDCEKFATGATLGWRILPLTYGQLNAGLLWNLLDHEFGGKE